MDRFPECQAITAVHEGTWSNHAADPGGATMYGVTQAVYNAWRRQKNMPTQSVRLITKTEVLQIYRTNYWEACGAPTLFPGVDLAVYDAAVNSGVSRAKKWLAASAGSNDHSVTVKKICRTRLSFMQSLAIWKTFGRGWGRRVADIEVKGVAMALKAMGQSTEQVKAAAKAESAAATKTVATAKKAEAAATGSAGASTALSVSETATTVDYTAIVVLAAIAVIAIIALVVINAKKRAAKERAEAYAAVAGGEA